MRRSPEAEEWRKLYKTTAWQSLRLMQLAEQPLCERHLERGAIVAANTVNHRTPHKGDRALFFSQANLQSLCKPCHDSDIHQIESRGYSTQVGMDGWPIDAAHPANTHHRGAGRKSGS